MGKSGGQPGPSELSRMHDWLVGV